MFHVKHDDSEDARARAAATDVFGGRLHLAERYHQTLATDGVDHGLIGPREVERLWVRHILNCAVIGERIPEGAIVIDVGSGAGLPGIPLAIARPDLVVTLVEPLLRRATFLERFVAEAGLTVAVVRGRAEDAETLSETGLADVVTSRAVAPLDRLARWCAPLARAGGSMIAIKGSSAADEIDSHRVAMKRAGFIEPTVMRCAEELLETPTTVVTATRVRSSRK